MIMNSGPKTIWVDEEKLGNSIKYLLYHTTHQLNRFPRRYTILFQTDWIVF